MLDDNPSSSLDSAFDLRNKLKQSQSISAQDRLFQQLGQYIYLHGWNAQTPQIALEETALLVGARHGLLLQQHGGALKVIAQHGKGLPQSTRIPMMKPLAQYLKSPVNFNVQQTYIPILWIFKTEEEVQHLHFHHLPLAYQQQAMGLLALASVKPLTINDVANLHGLCGLLGMALHIQQTTLQTVDPHLLQALTPREREVFAHLPSGASNAVLAEKLGIAPGTVKIHIERILNKLNVKDRTQAAVKAVEMGFKSSGV